MKGALTVQPKQKTGCMTFGIAVVAVILIIGWIAGELDQSGDDIKTRDPNDHSGAAAHACKQFVTDRLKAPKTADFPWLIAADQDPRDPAKYTVISHVDAQNSFGALIRTNYSCTVRDTGQTFVLLDLKTWTKT